MKMVSVSYVNRKGVLISMKAKEVLQKLEISRPTLSRYVKQGLIKVDSNINGKYRYNKDSVEKLLHNNVNKQ